MAVSKWRAQRNEKARARLMRTLPEVFPGAVLVHADGAVELIDFMSPRDDGADLVRLIRGVRGRVELRTEFILRFDYGFSVPLDRASRGRWPARSCGARHGGAAHAGSSPGALTSRPTASSQLDAGDTVPFILSYSPSHLSPPRRNDPERALRATEAFWHAWSDRCAPRRSLDRCGQAIAYSSEGADLRPDRRHRRRADDIAPRAGRRGAQLGLPVLLAEGRHVHAAGARERRLL